MKNENLKEVARVREVPRTPEHCGSPMRKMQNVSPSGALKTVYVCAKDCGAQVREPEPQSPLPARESS